MSEVIERLNLNLLLPAKKPTQIEPPSLVKLYLVMKEGEEIVKDQSLEAMERGMIIALKFKFFFDLSESDMDRIGVEVEKHKKSFIKAYPIDIAKSKAVIANGEILRDARFRVEIL